jgi:hypothetical protein
MPEEQEQDITMALERGPRTERGGRDLAVGSHDAAVAGRWREENP